MPNEIAKIKSTVRAYIKAANTGNPDAWEQTLDPAILWMPPNAPRLKGRRAVMAFTRSHFFTPFNIKLSVKLDQVQVYGSRAFAPATFGLDLTPKSGGEKIKSPGNAMHEFRKQRDGSWKYRALIWNYDKPVE